MKRISFLICIIIALSLFITTPVVFADCITTVGTITSVDDQGKNISFKDNYNGTIVKSTLSSKKTFVFRGDNKIKGKDLKVGDEIWITYWPNENEGNEPRVIKTEPNLEKEKTILIDTLCRASRMLAMEGLLGFSGHISGRLPGSDTFIIFPSQKGRDEYVPEDACEVRVEDCKQISGKMKVPQETVIHASIYKARPEVNSTIHIHGHYIILPTMVGKEFVTVCGHGSIFGAKVPVYTDPEKITRWKDADAATKILGNGRAVILRGHGANIAERSVEASFLAALHLQENAMFLTDALAIGEPTPLNADEIARSADNTYRPTSIEKSWIYFIGKGKRNNIFWD